MLGREVQRNTDRRGADSLALRILFIPGYNTDVAPNESEASQRCP